MRFACFETGGRPRVGIVDESGTVVRPLEPAVHDIVEIIERWQELKGTLRGGDAVPLAEAKLLAPMPAPRRNIICVGKNYREHAREFSHSGFEAGAVKGAEIDEFPAVFTKMPSSVVGPGATVSLHGHITQSVDYEAELTLVIGTGGREIRREDAYRHILGYTLIHDVTARAR